MRDSIRKKRNVINDNSSESISLDERIKQLEAELNASETSSEESDGESIENGPVKHCSDDGVTNGSEKQQDGVLCSSIYANDRIEGLPPQQLPKSTCSYVGKRKPPSQSPLQLPKRVPFACRPCGFIGENLQDFEIHQKSLAHIGQCKAAENEWSCGICNKQFTSKSQLKEHKIGKWHRQRASQRRERHYVKVCYDFIRGSCFRGEACDFEHRETKAMNAERGKGENKKRICKEFTQNQTCRFGDRCVFLHSLNTA
uniref:Uncharacterized protein AlNc14C193G8512 n=1 Tax=Albugo laibachii Nc14 TaxID=890382 RepID=F0WQ30_9STRA|nr:conserved hypothetical protein [Albugo laibachii Nc14]|eukprot:CCA23435.1 conserved hypothetical protein [Albugo laibachii Nc14]